MVKTNVQKSKEKSLKTTCWIVTEGMAGTENQCLGITNALGINPVIKQINLRAPWKWLSPMLGFENKWIFTGASLEESVQNPYPDILITAGRKSIAAARYITKKANKDILSVHVQDPRVHSSEFDLICVPAHDQMRSENTIVTDGAPNLISGDALESARQEFKNRFAHLPDKKIAAMIGGNSKTHKMPPEATNTLCDKITALAEQNYGIMVTASRRTGQENSNILKKRMVHQNIYYWDGTGDNPYHGFLALADYLLVTSDSVSMLSDAASTGKPVFMIPLDGDSKKFAKFYAHLIDIGCMRYFDGAVYDYKYEPLQDAQKIAVKIKALLKETT